MAAAGISKKYASTFFVALLSQDPLNATAERERERETPFYIQLGQLSPQRFIASPAKILRQGLWNGRAPQPRHGLGQGLAAETRAKSSGHVITSVGVGPKTCPFFSDPCFCRPVRAARGGHSRQPS